MIIGSTVSATASGYPVPGSGSWVNNLGSSSVNGTPYDPGSSQSAIANSAAGFYRRAVNGEWYTGNYATTDMSFFNGKTVEESQVDLHVSFGSQDDVNSYYSMYWLGYFQAPTTGTYNMAISSDDHSMVWIGTNAISGFTGSNCVITQNGTTTNSLSLTGGQWYPIRIWYDEHGGGNTCQLFIGQTGSTLYNMNYWHQTGRIAYDTVTNGLNSPTYFLSPSASSVNEGTALTFTATTKGIPDGTTLYYTTGSTGSYAIDAGRFSPGATGSFTITNNTGSFNLTVSADTTTATGNQVYNIVLASSLSPMVTVGNTVGITVNDTSLSRPQWTNGDATASGLSVSYRYYKFNITKTRVMPPDAAATQISELIILNGSTRLTDGTVTNPLGVNGSGEEPSKVVDGYYDTKWCDTAFSGNSDSSILIVDYGSAQTSNGFTFATANDSETRDPVRWIFSGSNDGSIWTVLYQQSTDATITINRKTLVSTVFNYPTAGSAVLNQPQTDYLSVPAGSYLNLGTTWTVEFWIYMNSSSSGAVNQQGGIWGVLNQGGWATTDSINIALSGGYLQINQGNNTAYYNKLVLEPTPLQWVHVAVVNNAGTNKVYYNGIEQVPAYGVSSQDYTASWTNSTNPLYIGSLGTPDNSGYGGSTFDGKITNLRITNTAVYAANFYPPTTLPTKISGTKLLWNPTDQSLVTDTSDSAVTITNSGATYSSSYPATNSTRGSAIFNGSTNRYYKVPGGSHLQLGTTWTIEWWQKSTALTAGTGNLYAVMGQAPDGGRIDIYYQGGNLLVQNGQTLCAEPAAGVWVHVALVNNAGSGTVYYDGVAQSASGNFGNYGQTQDLYIGKRGNNPFQFFNGKLTNIRITDTAVYTSNFVPDQLPAVIASHTKLLLRPTVDTIYGVDEGNLGLAVSSSGATYSSDYAPVTNTYTAITWNENDGYTGGYSGNQIEVNINDYPGILSVPNGATVVLTGQASGTFTVGSGFPFSQAVTDGYLRRLVTGLGIAVYGGDTLTFTWRT